MYLEVAYIEVVAMIENQNIEWKRIWRDEYLKWICGFANAQGGSLYIGKDDKGNVVGVDHAKKLSEDIPKKVRNILGIIVDVNMHTQDGKDYIEIVTAPHPYPVNYKGQYHYRTGSAKLELTGEALNRFMLEKQGKNWDAVPVPHVSVDDLKAETFDFFRKRGIQISVYEDKIIIWNDGILPEGWTAEKLTQQHPSRPYNPDIANAFFRSGYIESWGRGTINIIRMCVTAGLPAPEYQCAISDFQVEFRKDRFDIVNLKKLRLNERQITATFYVKEHGEITNALYQEINDVKKTVATEELGKLVRKGLLQQSGKGRGSKYIIGRF